MTPASIPPGLFSPSRLAVLVASLLVALASGTNYVFSAYGPQLGKRLKINHTQINLVGLAGNVGTYSSGPVWGRVVDTRGPRTLLVGAFFFLLVGYAGIRAVYDAGAENYGTASFWAVMICGFLTGSGGNAGLTSGMNSTAKSFPDKSRATTTSFVLSGFGLSAFFFSALAHLAFPGDTSVFLLVLALGTSLPMIIGFFLIRPIPLPSADIAQVIESGHSSDVHEDEEARSATLAAVFDRRDDSRTRLLAEEEDEERPYVHHHLHQVESSHYVVPHASDAVELSPTRSDTPRHSRHRSRSMPTRRSLSVAAARIGIDPAPNLHGKQLWIAGDFWLLFVIISLLSGTGLMYINNVGSISQALSAKGNPSYDEVEASKWQATQVSTVSITNCLGRILIGILADFAKNTLGLPRVYCASLVAFMFIVSQITCAMMEDVTDLWKASALLGLSYGGLFGLFPTISIDWFGIAHFSENWGYLSMSPLVGGNLFSIAFGKNLDAHAPSEPSKSVLSRSFLATVGRRGGVPLSEHQCFDGRTCYVDSLYMTTVACVLALLLCMWAAWKESYRRPHPPKAREPSDVVWENPED